MRILARVRDRLGPSLAPNEFFAAATVTAQARLVAAALRPPARES